MDFFFLIKISKLNIQLCTEFISIRLDKKCFYQIIKQ